MSNIKKILSTLTTTENSFAKERRSSQEERTLSPTDRKYSSYRTFDPESYELIWLNTNCYNNDKDKLELLKQLQRVKNPIKVFDNCDECIDYITDLKDQKVILITSGGCAREIISVIHGFQQLIRVYIHCLNKDAEEKWTKQFIKIKGISAEFETLITEFLKCQRIHERNNNDSVKINVYIRSSNDTLYSNLDSRNASFMFLQLLIDSLNELSKISDDDTKSRQDLIDIYKQQHEGNHDQVKILDEFQCNYSAEKAILWYTQDACLYRLLNQALRTNDFDIIFALRLFVTDLSNQLNAEYEEQFCYNQESDDNHMLTVYRGQAIAIEEITLIRENIGEFISFNSFLSTTTDKNTAIFFAQSSKEMTDDIKHILFQFEIDIELANTKAFADIRHLSKYREEGEVLLMLGTIFQIEQIEFSEQEEMWIAILTLCSEDDYKLKDLMLQVKKETCSSKITAPGYLFYRQGEFLKAKDYFLRILNDQSFGLSKRDLGSCYRGLGSVTLQLKQYNETLSYHQKELEIWEKLNEKIDMATAAQGIGQVYLQMEEYKIAAEHLCRALDLLPDDHIQRASSYIAIANIFQNLGDFDEALEYYKKCSNLQNNLLPENHPNIGRAYTNMAAAYIQMENYEKGRELCNKALSLYRKVLPSNHVDIQGIENTVLPWIEERLSTNEKI